MRKPQSGASCQISSLFSTLSRSIIRSINVIIGVFMHRNRLTVICITPCSRLLLCIDMRPGRECLSHKYLQEIIKTKYGSSPSEQLSFLHPDSACFLVFSSHQSRECSWLVWECLAECKVTLPLSDLTALCQELSVHVRSRYKATDTQARALYISLRTQSWRGKHVLELIEIEI